MRPATLTRPRPLVDGYSSLLLISGPWPYGVHAPSVPWTFGGFFRSSSRSRTAFAYAPGDTRSKGALRGEIHSRCRSSTSNGGSGCLQVKHLSRVFSLRFY